MSYEKHLSGLRHLMTQIQGQSLKQVLIREAENLAKLYASDVHPAEEIFHALKEKVYEKTNELSMADSFNIVADADNLRELKNELFEALTEQYQWDKTLQVLLEGVSENDIKLMEAVLENEHNYSKSCIANSRTSSYDNIGLYKFLIPVVRRIYADMPVRNLVGFQPMQGPVGLVYGLQYKYEEQEEREESTDEVSWPADITGMEGKRLTLEVVSEPIEAQSRKLEARWTIEAQQDMNAMNGLDIESELAQALAAEVRGEITREIVTDLKTLAGEFFDEKKLKGSKSEQQQQIHMLINRTCSNIAMKTRRGAGTYVVVSSDLFDFMESYGELAVEENKSFNDYALFKVGVLNETIDVYVSPVMEKGEILAGYKGSNEVDVGYTHCPYVPLMSTGIVIDPKTFQPVITLMTRYGKHVVEKDEDDENRLSDSRNYYDIVKVESKFLKEKEE